MEIMPKFGDKKPIIIFSDMMVQGLTITKEISDNQTNNMQCDLQRCFAILKKNNIDLLKNHPHTI